MTKIEVLVWGIKHIAENHGFNASTDYENDGQVSIWGGCNIPTISDAEMLCDDLGIDSDCVESSEYGVDVTLTEDWMNNEAESEYEESGLELWKKFNAVIGK